MRVKRLKKAYVKPHKGLYKFAINVDVINIISPDTAKSLIGRTLKLKELFIFIFNNF